MPTSEPGTVGLAEAVRSRWTLTAVTALLYWTGAHSLRPFITLRLDELGASDTFIGVAIAAYALLSLILAIPGGRLIDRIGTRRVLAFSLVAMSASGLAYAFAVTPMQVLVIQTIIGAVELGVWLALQAVITEAGSGQFRTRQLSLFALGWGAGLALGPLLGSAVYERYGFAATGFVYAATPMAALLVAAWIPHGARPPRRADRVEPLPSARTVVRSIGSRAPVRAVLLASFVSLCVSTLRQSFYPLFLERAGVQLSDIGILLSISAIASVGVRAAIPRIVDGFGTAWPLVVSLCTATAAISATPWIGAYWGLAIAAAVMGAGLGLTPPLTVDVIGEHTTSAERGTGMALRISSNRVAKLVQPVVFVGIAGVFGMAAAFPVSGLILGGVIVVSARGVTRSGLRSPSVQPSRRHGR